MSAEIVLAPVLDIQSVGALRARLLELRGQPVTIDGSAVERLGGLCLQVLLSARQTWASDGQPLAVDPMSDALADQWTRFGAPQPGPGLQGEPA